jgi:hypothetical protein
LSDIRQMRGVLPRVEKKARDEECNGIDDSCDGQIDERNPTVGFTCYTGRTEPALTRAPATSTR